KGPSDRHHRPANVLCGWNKRRDRGWPGAKATPGARRRRFHCAFTCQRHQECKNAKVMVTHDTTRSISGLARALAQQGVMSEQEAEALQSQAQASGVTFVEQVLAGKRISATQLAIFASRAFGVPLLDLSSFDIDQINKEY